MGDVRVADLEEEGKTVMDYLRTVYGYGADRVKNALGEITGEEL